MFRKPKKKPAAFRNGGKAKLSTSRGDDDDDDDGGGSAHDANADSTGASSNSGRRRPGMKRRRPGDGDSDDDSSSSSEGHDNDGRESTGGLLEQIRKERDDKKSNPRGQGGSKKKKKNMLKKDKSDWQMHQYKSSADQLTAKENATRTGDYQAEEKNAEGSGVASSAPAVDDATAGGGGDNSNNLPSSKSQPRNKFLAGPLRAAAFVRTTTRFDYQPDICKDYKETGFCGFGDTCIYLHDRGDTKSGWQMEREYEEKKKLESERKEREMDKFMASMQGQQDGGGDGHGDGINVCGGVGADADDDGLPFACHICRSVFRNPIVVTCQHYFCESCILAQVRGGDAACPICGKDTHGVFNHPQKLVAKKRRLVGRDGTWEEYRARMGKKESENE